jgi:hypothetical protein
VSAIFILPVSAFLEVSVAILEVSVAILEVSAALVESAEEAPPLPLQAAADTAIANAKKPILNEFFILVFFNK